MSDTAGVSNSSVLLHPLVIINISDHATRAKVTNKGVSKRVVGALLGHQQGKQMELLNSFELLTVPPPEGSECNSDEKVIIDEEFLKTKLSQFSEVFPDQEFLGWYSTGSQLYPYDTTIQKMFMAHNESPLYMIMDSVRASISKELPLEVFESEVRIVNNQPEVKFCSIPYKIETLEAERIAVDHIAHAASTTGSSAAGTSCSYLNMTSRATYN